MKGRGKASLPRRGSRGAVRLLGLLVLALLLLLLGHRGRQAWVSGLPGALPPQPGLQVP